MPIFVPHEGCPHQCVFCNQNHISGSPLCASAATVRAALEPMLGGLNCELAFYGGSFTAIAKEKQLELLEAAEPYRRNGLVSSIRLSTRPDAVTEDGLAILKELGVETVELGAQSMDREVLRKSGRGHSPEATENAARLVKNAGLNLILQMMTGLPGDSREKTAVTAKTLAGLHPDGVRIYPTVIVKDTPLEELWKRGVYKEHTVEEAVEWCADIVQVFEAEGIPVIRLGLNPTEELSGGAAVAGAYHPALGELVYSRLRYRKLRDLLADAMPLKNPVVFVNPRMLSKSVGQKKENLLRLQREFSLDSLRILPADLAEDEILIRRD